MFDQRKPKALPLHRPGIRKTDSEGGERETARETGRARDSQRELQWEMEIMIKTVRGRYREGRWLVGEKETVAGTERDGE